MKPEVGKRYWTRHGAVTAPIKRWGDGDYHWTDGHVTWTAVGRYLNALEDMPLDLVAEYDGPELRPPSARTYRIGQWLRNPETGEEYLLAQVAAVGVCCLINVELGNRETDQVKVRDVMRITQAELNAMGGCGLVEKKEDEG